MKPTPSIFSMGLARFGLLALFTILLYYRLVLPALVVLFLLFTVKGMRFWSRYTLKRLSSTIQVRPSRLFAGESAGLTVTLSNLGILPMLLSWEMERVPFNFSGSTLLKWFSAKDFLYEINPQKRGVYLVPPLSIVSWDGLGLTPSTATLGTEATLLVYPKLLPLPDLSFKPSGPVGLHNDHRPILPDPIRVAGLREYTPDLPARLIHWKASAQKDRLLARITEPSADRRLCLAVNAEEFSINDAEVFETALSLAATLICQADEEHIPFALMINAQRNGLPGPAVLPLGTGPEHITAALENLARIELRPAGSLLDLLFNPVNQLPWGTSLVVLGIGEGFPLPTGLRNPVFYDVRSLCPPRPQPQERNNPHGATAD